MEFFNIPERFKNITPEQISFVLCKGHPRLSPGHVKQLLNSRDGQIYYRRKSKEDGAIMVFRDLGKRYYIDLLCSTGKGLGTELVTQLRKRAKLEGKKYIELVSTNSAREFYLKRGFKSSKSNPSRMVLFL